MIDIQNLVKIEYHGKPVLTTKQLAAIYGCSVHTIRSNFSYAKKEFQEDIHYYYITGEELRKFKEYFSEIQAHSSGSRNSVPADSPFTNLASSLYLWTHKGCIRHCKMINSPEAWAMFDILEKIYFATLNNQITSYEISAKIPADKIYFLNKLLDKCGGVDRFERIIDKLLILN